MAEAETSPSGQCSDEVPGQVETVNSLTSAPASTPPSSSPAARGIGRRRAQSGADISHQRSPDSSWVEAHRRNHTPSKLPTFRLVDVRDSSALDWLQKQAQNQIQTHNQNTNMKNEQEHARLPASQAGISGASGASGAMSANPSLIVSPCVQPGRAGPGVSSQTQAHSLSAVDTPDTHHLAPQNPTLHSENSTNSPPNDHQRQPQSQSSTPTPAPAPTLRVSVLSAPAPPSTARLTPVTEADTELVSNHCKDGDDTSADHNNDLDGHEHDHDNRDHGHDHEHEQSPTSSRGSSYQTASTSVQSPNLPNVAKRSTSIPVNDATAAATAATPTKKNVSPSLHRSHTDSESPCFHTPLSRPRTRRTNSYRHLTSARSPLAARATKHLPFSPIAPKQPPQVQRELILPKAVQGALSDENDKVPRRSSSTSRSGLTYKPPAPGSSTPGRIPPIRAFRSSGSRVSSLPDMDHPSLQYYDEGEDYRDSDPRDRSLRTLQGGRTSNDWSREVAAPDADGEITESENNTADIFMNIAREDSSSAVPRRRYNNRGEDEEQESTVSRGVRTARTPRQRPMSVYNMSSLKRPPSPPPVSRRLSDTTSRTRRTAEDQHEQNATRDSPYQSSAIGRPVLKLDSARASSRGSTLKPSPITPRTQSVVESSSGRDSIFARRPPKSNDGHSRSSSFRQPTGLSKSFNSSPLVPKSADTQHTVGMQLEASESSNSTAAPSTVWDELDELKSRIHRLELTGKMPKTSGAAISRTSDERPPTADTGATTLSSSPKRAQTEVISTASSLRDTQPILRSALSKTKPFVSSDVYDAIEAAASDALSLSQIVGPSGHPGPISSGASTIGAGGPSTITDRQLRKKTDGICRSLTDLCLALTDQGTQRGTQFRSTSGSRPQTRGTSRATSRHRDDDVPSSPPTMKVFTGRQSAGPDEALPSVEPFGSPRAARLEKRATFNFTGMNGSAHLSSPRYASSAVGGDDTLTGRKSSLVIARARRGVTEEPEDQGRKTALLRTRRANTEEPEEEESSRNSSLIYPPRRVTTISRVSNIDEEPQAGQRAPSRAVTELGNGLRIAVPPRDSIVRRSRPMEPASASSAQAPRRLITSGLPTPGAGPYSSRLMTPTTPGSRRFLQVSRQPQDGEDTTNMTGRLTEDRGQRYSVGGQSTTSIARGPSLHRKRNSAISNISGTVSNVGGYR